MEMKSSQQIILTSTPQPCRNTLNLQETFNEVSPILPVLVPNRKAKSLIPLRTFLPQSKRAKSVAHADVASSQLLVHKESESRTTEPINSYNKVHQTSKVSSIFSRQSVLPTIPETSFAGEAKKPIEIPSEVCILKSPEDIIMAPTDWQVPPQAKKRVSLKRNNTGQNGKNILPNTQNADESLFDSSQTLSPLDTSYPKNCIKISKKKTDEKVEQPKSENKVTVINNLGKIDIISEKGQPETKNSTEMIKENNLNENNNRKSSVNPNVLNNKNINCESRNYASIKRKRTKNDSENVIKEKNVAYSENKILSSVKLSEILEEEKTNVQSNVNCKKLVLNDTTTVIESEEVPSKKKRITKTKLSLSTNKQNLLETDMTLHTINTTVDIENKRSPSSSMIISKHSESVKNENGSIQSNNEQQPKLLKRPLRKCGPTRKPRAKEPTLENVEENSFPKEQLKESFTEDGHLLKPARKNKQLCKPPVKTKSRVQRKCNVSKLEKEADIVQINLNAECQLLTTEKPKSKKTTKLSKVNKMNDESKIMVTENVTDLIQNKGNHVKNNEKGKNCMKNECLKEHEAVFENSQHCLHTMKKREHNIEGNRKNKIINNLTPNTPTAKAIKPKRATKLSKESKNIEHFNEVEEATIEKSIKPKRPVKPRKRTKMNDEESSKILEVTNLINVKKDPEIANKNTATKRKTKTTKNSSLVEDVDVQKPQRGKKKISSLKKDLNNIDNELIQDKQNIIEKEYSIQSKTAIDPVSDGEISKNGTTKELGIRIESRDYVTKTDQNLKEQQIITENSQCCNNINVERYENKKRNKEAEKLQTEKGKKSKTNIKLNKGNKNNNEQHIKIIEGITDINQNKTNPDPDTKYLKNRTKRKTAEKKMPIDGPPMIENLKDKEKQDKLTIEEGAQNHDDENANNIQLTNPSSTNEPNNSVFQDNEIVRKSIRKQRTLKNKSDNNTNEHDDNLKIQAAVQISQRCVNNTDTVIDNKRIEKNEAEEKGKCDDKYKFLSQDDADVGPPFQKKRKLTDVAAVKMETAVMRSETKRNRYNEDARPQDESPRCVIDVRQCFGLRHKKVSEPHPGVTLQSFLHIAKFVMTGSLSLQKEAYIEKSTTDTTYFVIQGVAKVRISNVTKIIKSEDENNSFYIPKCTDSSITNEENMTLKLLFTKFKG